MIRLGVQPAVEPWALTVGDKIRLAGASRHDERWWWTVHAVSEHFTACVHQADFLPKGTLCYTVLDWRNGVRGPCNLIGQGYGEGTYSPAECAEMLAEFEFVEGVCPARGRLYALEVSHRNRVPLKVLDVRPCPVWCYCYSSPEPSRWMFPDDSHADICGAS